MAKTAAALHILVKEEKLALDLLEQLKNRQGQMVPAFDKVVFSCPELEPTGPLHTQFGYHIIKVLYRK